MDRIRSMNREQQVTVVMVCHDVEVVLDYAERALLMSAGRLLADLPVSRVFREPAPLQQASVLPPQMIDLSLRLGFPDADTPEAVAEYILASLSPSAPSQKDR